jgi:hypothetical protein
MPGTDEALLSHRTQHSCLQAKPQTGSTNDALNTEGPMKQMLSYRTVSLAQTGIFSGIHPMALRNLPHKSPASLIHAFGLILLHHLYTDLLLASSTISYLFQVPSNTH